MKIDVVNSAVIIDDVDTGVKFVKATDDIRESLKSHHGLDLDAEIFKAVVDELKDRYSEWVEPRDTMKLIERQLRDKRINTQ